MARSAWFETAIAHWLERVQSGEKTQEEFVSWFESWTKTNKDLAHYQLPML